MLNRDAKFESDNLVSLADYLASFWNPEAVKKIQEARGADGAHAFKSDDEFEKSLISGEYKNNPLLDAVIKMNKNKSLNPDNNKPSHPRSKLPTDLSSINRTLNKFNDK